MGINLLILTKYNTLGASSRLRLIQYLNSFKAVGFNCTINSLIDDQSLRYRYAHGRYPFLSLLFSYIKRLILLLSINKYNLILIEKEVFPWLPYLFEKFLLRGSLYALDYDDAVFLNYNNSDNFLINFLLKNKLSKLMRNSSLAICGSSYLVDFAKSSGCQFVGFIPTVIDLDRYFVKNISQNYSADTIIICWIGSPSTVKYLNLISQSLRSLSLRVRFVLRVIGAKFSLEGVNVECHDWFESTEVSLISECHIGIMPLALNEWELGKCGYKLIQYMACGLPVVATDFGANSDIVEHGLTGYLVQSDSDWEHALFALILNADLRRQMGDLGRISVETNYCLQVAGPKVAAYIKTATKFE